MKIEDKSFEQQVDKISDNKNDASTSRCDYAELQNEKNESKLEISPNDVFKLKVDRASNRFPYCIVWTPLPLISWIIPCIGHTGICTSEGIIHDFAGSYYVGQNKMAFGDPYKYVMLRPNLREQEEWNSAIDKADDRFNNEEHNICLNNCHSHVAHALNILKYKEKTDYNMIHIWWMCIIRSRYVSWMHLLKTYMGFVIVLCIILLTSLYI